jgi:CRISPR type IV-associated protein Csf1
MTASQLFAKDEGPHNCYYCGGWCSGYFDALEYVKDTFTNRDIVHFPGSKFVCHGCVDSMGSGADEMLMIDGTTKRRENDRGMQPRMYSWVLTIEKKLAGTKAHIEQFRDTIFDPPEPPFAIVLADSGQKQIIFRAPVALDRDVFPVMLEDDPILVIRDEFGEYLKKAMRLCAATGKPALRDNLGMSAAIAVDNYYGDLSALEYWAEIQNEPMAKLAAWVCPNKEVSQNEYPNIERRGIPAQARRVGRPESQVAGNGAGSDQGRGSQIPLFSPHVV